MRFLLNFSVWVLTAKLGVFTFNKQKRVSCVAWFWLYQNNFLCKHIMYYLYWTDPSLGHFGNPGLTRLNVQLSMLQNHTKTQVLFKNLGYYWVKFVKLTKMGCKLTNTNKTTVFYVSRNWLNVFVMKKQHCVKEWIWMQWKQPIQNTAVIISQRNSTQLNSTLFIEHIQHHKWNQSAVQRRIKETKNREKNHVNMFFKYIFS